MNNRTIKSFTEKFSPNMRQIECSVVEDSIKSLCQTLVKNCSKPLTLNTYYYLNKFYVNNQLIIINNLSKFNCMFLNPDEFYIFELIANKFGQKLNHLSIRFDYMSDGVKAFNSLSQFKALKSFKIEYLIFQFNFSNFIQCLQTIANNCQQLENLTIDLMNTSDQFFFGFLQNFKNLRRLELKVRDVFEIDFSFDCLKNMSQLSVLKINSAQPNDSFFENIDKIVPNLRQLNLNIGKISDKHLNCISRLKRLKTIGLSTLDHWSPPTVTYQIFNKFIKNLKRLQIFRLNTRILSISGKELIALQNNWPNIQLIT